MKMINDKDREMSKKEANFLLKKLETMNYLMEIIYQAGVGGKK